MGHTHGTHTWIRGRWGWKIWLRGGGAAGGWGERPFSGQGRLLRGLRAEVNCGEGKRRKKREEGGREREKAVCQPGPAPTFPTSQLGDIPSHLGLRFFICKARRLHRWVPRSSQLHHMALEPQTPNPLRPRLSTMGWFASQLFLKPLGLCCSPTPQFQVPSLLCS